MAASVPATLTPEATQFIAARLKPVISAFTYDGVAIGNFITDAELQTASATAGQALLDFLNSPSI